MSFFWLSLLLPRMHFLRPRALLRIVLILVLERRIHRALDKSANASISHPSIHPSTTHPMHRLLPTHVRGTMSEAQYILDIKQYQQNERLYWKERGQKWLQRRFCGLLPSPNKVRQPKGPQISRNCAKQWCFIFSPACMDLSHTSPSIKAAPSLPLPTLSSFPSSFTACRCDVRNNRHLKQCESILINHFKVLKLISGFLQYFIIYNLLSMLFVTWLSKKSQYSIGRPDFSKPQSSCNGNNNVCHAERQQGTASLEVSRQTELVLLESVYRSRRQSKAPRTGRIDRDLESAHIFLAACAFPLWSKQWKGESTLQFPMLAVTHQ